MVRLHWSHLSLINKPTACLPFLPYLKFVVFRPFPSAFDIYLTQESLNSFKTAPYLSLFDDMIWMSRIRF